jgi:hypothetical protein
MLDLPNVTLCSVETRTPSLAARAMAHSMRGARFADAVMFTDRDVGQLAIAGARHVSVGAISTMEEYSRFILHDLAAHISTDFVLVVQWDGFVLDPCAWRPAFLDYDFVGAPWHWLPPHLAVGNGGFSLRSLRLLHAMRDPDMVIHHPEDVCIGQTNRQLLEQRYQIRFAPVELASAFSYETRDPPSRTFGFHGTNNLATALGPAEMIAWAREMTTEMAFGAGALLLIDALVRRNQCQAAGILLKKRLAAGDRCWPVLSLWMRLRMRRLLYSGGMRTATE